MNEESDEQIRARCAERARGPGKFQGEPAWLVYLVEQCLETGCSEDYFDDFDDDTGTVTLVVPDDNDRRIFPELAGVPRVAWWESEQGFIYKRVLSQAEWYAWRDKATAGDDEDDGTIFVEAGTRVEIVRASSDGRFTRLGIGTIRDDARVGSAAGLDVYDVYLDTGEEVSAMGYQIEPRPLRIEVGAAEALNHIHTALSGHMWDADTMQAVCEILQDVGFIIAPPREAP